MFVAEHLYKARQPFTSHVPFTIVNAYSPLSDVSLGFDKAPPPDIFYSRNTPLTLTFALSKDRMHSELEPNIIRKPYRNMFLWGSSVMNRTKFLTLKVDPDIAAAMKFEQMLISNMRYIYFAVGAFSKNLVRNNNWYGSSPSFIEDGHTGLATMVKSITIPDLFKHYDYTFWAYNEQIWRDASNLMVLEHWNDNLKLYYAAYLFNIEPKFGEIAAVFHDTMEDFLVKGLFEIVGGINGSKIDKAGTAALIYLYRNLWGIHPSYIDEKQWAASYISKIRSNLQDDAELKQRLVSVLTNKREIARQFLTFSAGDNGIIGRFKGVDHVFR